MENVFGTSKDVEVVEQILRGGKEETGKAIRTHTGNTNLTKGSFSVDTKGKSLSGM